MTEQRKQCGLLQIFALVSLISAAYFGNCANTRQSVKCIAHTSRSCAALYQRFGSQFTSEYPAGMAPIARVCKRNLMKPRIKPVVKDAHPVPAFDQGPELCRVRRS